jgi:two-component system, chemotaxis family, CheB/CheR fusion protein
MQESDGQQPEQEHHPAAPITPTDTSPPRGNPFPIVGIGSSAGGFEAFTEFLAAIPPDTGMAFVLVQPLDPQHERLLPELLAPSTKMPVLPVSDGVAIQPDHVYVVPPNTSIELTGGVIRLTAREAGLHLPIDIFFGSLAKVQGSRAIGVVLSGDSSDSSAGVRAIKAECGITFAQDETTARFGGMPKNAVATGAIDYVLSPSEIAAELNTLARHPFLLPSRPGEAASETLPEGADHLRRIFAMMNAATRVDFTGYKPTTIRRRIGRRMTVLRMGTMADYVRYIEQHPEELRELFRDLLINVTRFFRDPDSFEALSRVLAAVLPTRKHRDQPVRVWVPGCATGEEIYSLAICLYEVLQQSQTPLSMQLFGTDISEVALERARRGVYSAVIEDDVSPERLRRFFTKVDSTYQINKSVRESCIFARHDVTKDPPLPRLDLISCRNLLIYLDQTAQRSVLPIFHYALKPTGLLVLGSAEITLAAPDLFAPVEEQRWIYSRKETLPRLPLGTRAGAPTAGSSFPLDSPASSNSANLQTKLERIIHSRYSHDAVLVNSDGQIVQFRGRISPYLDASPGEAQPNLLRVAKESLVLPLRRALQSAADTDAPVREAGLQVEIAGKPEEVTIEVTPIADTNAAQRFSLVVFVRNGNADIARSFNESAIPADQHVARLQREGSETGEYLRNLKEGKEDYKTYVEELRAAKEDLQSTAEELTAVNEELQSRNQELNTTGSDLNNLLSSVTVPIVMVDSELRVRRFNKDAAKLLDLHAVDLGRPVGHLRGRVETLRLEQQVRTVIDTLHPISEELQDSEGCWYSLSIRPYRTMDDRIAGAVISFQDIDRLKRGLQAAEAARDYAEALIEMVRVPLLALNSELRVQRATTAFYETFLVSREETEGRFLYDLGNGQWNESRLRELIGAALFRSEAFDGFEVEHDFPHIGRRTMRLNGRRIPSPQSPKPMLLLSIEDVTERPEIAEIRSQRSFEAAKDGRIVVDAERTVIEDVNPFFLELTGYSREDVTGKPLSDVARLLGIPELASAVGPDRESGIIRYDDLQLSRPDGRSVSVEVVGNPYRVGSRPVIQLNFRDVTSRKQAAKALKESEQRLRLFVESVFDYALFQLDRDGLILTWNLGAQRLLGWREDEAIGRPASIVFTPDDIAKGEPERELEAARTIGRAEDERFHVRKDGSRFFASAVLTQLRDEQNNLIGFAKIMRDITARKEQQELLDRSIKEKSAFIREIHHRVKNNLQVIVSLVSLQSSHTNDPQLIAALEETEGRLRAIARIHERLYASDDLTAVEFAAYLANLVQELVALHSESANQIELAFEAADMVMQIERAIPLGLIANELIVNSLKHGLRHNPGRLRVELAYLDGSFRPEMGETLDDAWARVRVVDSGPGLPPGLDLSNTKTMGFRLINLLVRQLRGRLEVGAGPGADIAVTFPLQIE